MSRLVGPDRPGLDSPELRSEFVFVGQTSRSVIPVLPGPRTIATVPVRVLALEGDDDEDNPPSAHDVEPEEVDVEEDWDDDDDDDDDDDEELDEEEF